MQNSLNLLLAGALGAGLLAACTTPEPTLAPEYSHDGLQKVANARLDSVWVQPDIDLSAYGRVLLRPISVEFDKNWDPNRSRRSPSARVRPEDVAEIRSQLSELAQEVFVEVLEAGGYPVVDAPGPDVLQVDASIVDLYVNAPAAAEPIGRSRSYVANAGQMTLVGELRDSQSGEILVRFTDRQQGRETPGQLQWQTSVDNRAEARRFVRFWAERLRFGLDASRTAS